jgi:cell wall-associated NlpC family hydrolase
MPRTFLAFAAVPLLALSIGACASTGAVPRPFPSPGGSTASVPQPTTDQPAEESPRLGNEDARIDGSALTSTALALRGTPYRTGGTNPESGFDCSGFTQYVFAQYGLALPREVRDQYRVGEPVNPEQVAAGDLLFFTTTAPGPTHVGISLGGDAFIHAPSSTGVVRVEHLSASYWSRRFLAAHRVN